MILSFWRLLQGEPLLWATLLAKRVREALAHEIAPTPESARASALVDQFLDLLAGEPALRLQTLLEELQATIPACSPLTGPAACLVRLARGQTRSHVIDTISKLSNEVQHHAAHADWPEERLRDLGWLLALAHALVHAPQEEQRQILITTLSHLCAACGGPEQEGAEAEISARLIPVLACSEQDDALLLRRLQALLEGLPDMGPQPPRADPRLNPVWRFRLLRELISLDAAPTERGEDPEPFADDFPLVEHVLWAITRVLSAWLFPPDGYFRDPYTDASILWVAAGAFWPSIADQITEPVDEPSQRSSPWLAEEGAIPAQIPLARVRELAALLSAPSSNLPEQHHLARWGAPTMRVEADGPYCLSAWHAYFEQRRQTLLAFLEEAIAREEPILCSL